MTSVIEQINFMPIAVQPLAFVSSLGLNAAGIYNQSKTCSPIQLDRSSVDFDTHIPSKIYGAPALENDTSFSERFMTLLERSLADVLPLLPKHLPTALEASQLLVLVQLPTSSAERAKQLSPTRIESHLQDHLSNLGAPWNKVTLKLIETSDAISQAMQLLQPPSELTAIVVGAVDSLFEQNAIASLDQQYNELWTTSHSEGVAIGEAAGWLLLTRDAKQAPLLLKQSASAQGKHALVSAVENLQLQQRINVLVKLYSNTNHHVNQQHEINLRFLDIKLENTPEENNTAQLVDLVASCGYTGCANNVIGLAYLAGSALADDVPWDTALVLNQDIETQTAYSFLVSKGNIYDHA
jgi:hypothetical protein